jgi:hypothetical protein
MKLDIKPHIPALPLSGLSEREDFYGSSGLPAVKQLLTI